MRGPANHAREAVRDELSEDMARAVINADWIGSSHGVIGIDGRRRVVVYDDDGMVYREPVEDGEPVGHDHPDHDSRSVRASPHNGEGAVLWLDTDGWEWTHPRYRWITED